MESYSQKDLYDAGRRIKEVLSKSNDKSLADGILQALIRDFVPQHEELLEDLLKISTGTEFAELLKMENKQMAKAQKNAIVESLIKTYREETVKAAESLLCGLLSLSCQDKLTSPEANDEAAVKNLPIKQHINLHDLEVAEKKGSSLDKEAARPIQGASFARPKNLMIATITLGSIFGAWVWNIAGSRYDAAVQTNIEKTANKCTSSQQTEMELIVRELTLKIELVDPRRMTGGTWQSILSTYNQNKSMLPQSFLLNDYIAKAKKAKSLDAIGCFYNAIP